MASKRFDAVTWFLDDWWGSTARKMLSPAGRQAYQELCWLQYSMGNKRVNEIPNEIATDDRAIARAIAFDLDEWLAVKDKVLEFFSNTSNGGLSHPKVQKEIDYKLQKILAGERSGKRRGERKAERNEERTHQRKGNARVGVGVVHHQKETPRAKPDHPDDVDVDADARRLLELWRREINSTEADSKALPTLRARLVDGWSPAQLRLAIERKAAEVQAEGRQDKLRYKVHNLFRDPDWVELLSEKWQAPAAGDERPKPAPDPLGIREPWES